MMILEMGMVTNIPHTGTVWANVAIMGMAAWHGSIMMIVEPITVG